MARNNQKTLEKIGSARKQVDNENDLLEDRVFQPIQESIPELIRYIEDQVDNLKDYAENLKLLCRDNVCTSYLDAQIDELNCIKSHLCKNLDRVIYPPEEPSLNPNGFLIHFFKTSAPVLGDLMFRLNKALILLDSIHDGLVPKD